MQLVIDQEEQDHIYGCLLAGNAEWSSIRKKLAKMNREDDSVEAALQLNAKLRKSFNPRAEDEALEKARAKDPAQMDIEDVASSGETGGATRVHLHTGDPLTTVQVRDALRQLGLAVYTADIDAWNREDRITVEAWIGQVIVANAVGSVIPDEPSVIVQDTVPVVRVQERLDLGPYVVIESEGVFEVQHAGSHTVIAYDPDQYDAQFLAADKNADMLSMSEMSEQDQHKWAAAGPWGVLADGECYSVVAGREREAAFSQEDAFAICARYNRSIAQRGAGEGWTEAPPPKADVVATFEMEESEYPDASRGFVGEGVADAFFDERGAIRDPHRPEAE